MLKSHNETACLVTYQFFCENSICPWGITTRLPEKTTWATNNWCPPKSWDPYHFTPQAHLNCFPLKKNRSDRKYVIEQKFRYNRQLEFSTRLWTHETIEPQKKLSKTSRKQAQFAFHPRHSRYRWVWTWNSILQCNLSEHKFIKSSRICLMINGTIQMLYWLHTTNTCHGTAADGGHTWIMAVWHCSRQSRHILFLFCENSGANGVSQHM